MLSWLQLSVQSVRCLVCMCGTCEPPVPALSREKKLARGMPLRVFRSRPDLTLACYPWSSLERNMFFRGAPLGRLCLEKIGKDKEIITNTKKQKKKNSIGRIRTGSVQMVWSEIPMFSVISVFLPRVRRGQSKRTPRKQQKKTNRRMRKEMG